MDESAGRTEDRHAAVGPVDVHGMEDLRGVDAHAGAGPLEPGAVNDQLQSDPSARAGRVPRTARGPGRVWHYRRYDWLRFRTSKFSRARPVPLTTDVCGSSATIAGKPVCIAM